MKTVAMFLLMEDYDNGKYESISKIIARADLQGNLQCFCEVIKDFYLICAALLL